MNGQRQLVFVTGEPGIGKTALVEDVSLANRRRPALRIGRGQCVELYGAGEAYLPLLEALGRLGRAAGGEQVVQILKQHAPTWLTQLPALLADRGSRGRAAPSAGGHARPDAAGAGGGPGRPEPVTRPSSCSWKTCTGATRPRSTCWRCWPAGAKPARLLVLGTYRPADVAASAHPLKPREAGTAAARALRGDAARVPERGGRGDVSLAALSRARVPVGARARASSETRTATRCSS